MTLATSPPSPDQQSESAIRARIARRVGGSPLLKGYVRGKLATDPAYRAVLDLLQSNPQPVLDLGCGLGLLAFYLREHGYGSPITGIDPAVKKIARARQTAHDHYKGVSFEVGDAREAALSDAAIVLLDILHYLDDASQVTLLRRLASQAADGGIVVIRNAPRDQSWRYRLTYLEEIWVRSSRWIVSRRPINFPTTDEIVGPFRDAGCGIRVAPLWGSTPFNSHLYVFSPATTPCVS